MKPLFLPDNHDVISVKMYELEGADDSVDYASLNPSADFFAPPRGECSKSIQGVSFGEEHSVPFVVLHLEK